MGTAARRVRGSDSRGRGLGQGVTIFSSLPAARDYSDHAGLPGKLYVFGLSTYSKKLPPTIISLVLFVKE